MLRLLRLLLLSSPSVLSSNPKLMSSALTCIVSSSCRFIWRYIIDERPGDLSASWGFRSAKKSTEFERPDSRRLACEVPSACSVVPNMKRQGTQQQRLRALSVCSVAVNNWQGRRQQGETGAYGLVEMRVSHLLQSFDNFCLQTREREPTQALPVYLTSCYSRRPNTRSGLAATDAL